MRVEDLLPSSEVPAMRDINHEILQEPEGVLERIYAALTGDDQAAEPSP